MAGSNNLMQLKFNMCHRFRTVFFMLVCVLFFALAGQAQVNTDEYKKTIESADNYFSKGDYINAKASYQIAVRLAPGEQYPKDRLQQSLDMIKAQMNINSLYTQKIQVADNLLSKKDLEGALKVYQEALTIIPADAYATEKIKEINKSLEDARVLEENYKKNIANGDQFLKDGVLDKALAEYQNAAKLKPSETYPKEKITLVEKKIAETRNISGEYENALQAADQAISRNKYDEAIGFLETAIRLKPDEALPKQKLAEAQNLKSAWDSYSSIISQADEYYISKDFEKAKEKYSQAQSIKPSDEYPKSMLEKIDIALMDISRANSSSYEVSIALADKLYNEQDYERAMAEYKNALHFKPDEEYAKQRISDINKTLGLRKSQDEAYAQSIAKADNLFKEERYEEARDEYLRAGGIKSMEDYPKVKVEELNALLSKLASQREMYNNLIKGADRLFFSDNYVEAREQYRAASNLFPKEKYPNDQIVMINEILGVRDKYTKAVTSADQLLYKKDYEGALLEYRNAAGINPKETYPLEKIKEIETIMAANAKPQKNITAKRQEVDTTAEDAVSKEDYQEAAEAYKKNKVFEIEVDSAELAAMEARDNQYQDAILEGDNALEAKEYDKALTAYQAALNVKPNESYPKGKIDEINKIKVELARQALENQYKEAIANADKSLLAKDYDKALAAYQAASELKPAENYPKSKITEINNIKGELAAKEALDNQYKDAIANADKALAAKDYDKALLDYQAAIKIKPNESYPQGKITEINAVKAELAAKETLDKQYKEAIANADKALQAKDYETALAAYQSAQNLKPGESYPKGKITEINAIKGEVAAKEALDNQYKEAIANADKALSEKDYDKAITSYQAAQNLKPGESYPKGKITEINALKGELAAKEAVENQYKEAIANADKALNAKEYDKALMDYQAALKIKPDETYPKGKITEINAAKAELAAKEALDNQYKEAISNADKALQAKDYETALAGYQAAQNLKPGENYPKGKISEINVIKGEVAAKEALDNQYKEAIANADKAVVEKDYDKALAGYKAAQTLKPGENYPKGKITEINAIKTELAAKETLENQYKDAIANADKALAAKDFNKALMDYQAALKIKPDETYPKGKITEINAAKAELAAKEALENQYKEAVANADKAFQAKDYETALAGYQSALKLKPAESLPSQKISEIQALKEEARKQKEADDKYEAIIASADDFLKKKQYEDARSSYQEAEKLRPSEEYPKNQVISINQVLETMATEKDQAYQVAISKADNYFALQDYDMAKLQYERAIELKPNEKYPGDKLRQTNDQIIIKKQTIQKDYDKAITDADNYFTTKVYDNAIETYRNASALKPDEAYPKEMANRILKLLSERSIVQININALLIANNTDHRFEYIPVPVKDRKSNYIYFKARNVSKKEYKLIISFGKDQVKNGGLVVKVPPGEEIHDYVVRVSAQYKWFSEDNNWISFYPEGGDIEVYLMQISFSD